MLLALAWFGAGAFLAAPTDAVGSRDVAVALEIDYEWPHAMLGVTALGTPGFSNLKSEFVGGRADWLVLSGPVAPFVGGGLGFFGQTLQCDQGVAGCENFRRATTAGLLEAGAMLRTPRWMRAILSVMLTGALVRDRSSPDAVPTPVPLLLVGLRVLG